MPVAVVEACAMGLPVVATSVGGIPDLLVDGETGLLVPDDDHEAMTDAIIRVLMEPGLAGRLSANGLKLAEQSSWQQVRPKWESLFEELMEADAISMKPISSA
jgi:glycosyltransferase involved in cell wall biosynthesis